MGHEPTKLKLGDTVYLWDLTQVCECRITERQGSSSYFSKITDENGYETTLKLSWNPNKGVYDVCDAIYLRYYGSASPSLDVLHDYVRNRKKQEIDDIEKAFAESGYKEKTSVSDADKKGNIVVYDNGTIVEGHLVGHATHGTTTSKLTVEIKGQCVDFWTKESQDGIRIAEVTEVRNVILATDMVKLRNYLLSDAEEKAAVAQKALDAYNHVFKGKNAINA